MQFQAIPEWTKPDAPRVAELFTVFLLLDMEGKWVRLSAADQRAIMGSPIFGKREFRVNADHTVNVRVACGFGQDCDILTWTLARMEEVAKATS